jgi:TonB-linked SusC/RagA family outer membrane protein
MKKILFMILLLVAGFWQQARAQDRTVTGKVLDKATNQGLPGVTVIVKNRPTVGTSTNIDGVYSLSVPANATTLVYSFVGYASQEIALTGASTVDVTLNPDTKQLNEVVVTALGLQANRDQLGTAQATVEGQALVRSGETSVINGLAGKTPGVLITRSSGDPGASSNIQIRGASTITGNLQPLIVVDGIPISNSSVGNEGILASNGGAGSNQVDGVVQASRLNDINPDDIASMEVLKGAAASVVWGTRGANGVIVITTKQGRSAKGKLNLSYRSSISIDQINREVPLQRSFGQGASGLFSTTGVRSWGDRIADRSGAADAYITDPTAAGYQGYITFADGSRRYNIPSGTIANPHGGKNSRETFNHSKDMFNNGYSWDNIGSISGGDERSNFYLSIGNTYTKGIARQNSDNDRTTVRLNVDRQLTDKFRTAVNMTYARTRSNRVQQGSNTSGIFLGGLRTPPDFNNSLYIGTYTDPTGNNFPNRQSSYRNPLGRTTSPGFDNPLWTEANVTNQSRVNRFLGSIELNYQLAPWLNILNRTGVDTYTDTRYEYFPVGSAAIPVGSLTEETIQENQFNNDLIARATTHLTENITLSGLVGYNLNVRRSTQIGASANTFINPFSPPQLDNTPVDTRSVYNLVVEQRTAALYGQVDLGLFDQVFLNGTVRGEQSSTFGPEAKKTFIYPAGTAAWQFTKLAALADNSVLSFGKLRFAYGQVGVQPTPYLTRTYYSPASPTYLGDGWGTTLDAAAYQGGVVRSATEGNAFLKPERKTEFEYGLDMRFLNNRLGFTATTYFNETRDAILSVPRASTTGFTSINQNAASIRNRGLELSIDGDVIKTENFTFNLAPNFSLNRNKVLSLNGAVSVPLTGFTGSESRAVQGYQLGALWGNQWARNEQGAYVLDANGFPTLGSQGVIGDPNPQWRGGVNLNFRYRAISLNVLVDHVHATDVWNGTKGALYSYGTAADTEQQTTVTAAQAAQLSVFQINAGGSAFQRATTVATRYAPNTDGTYTFRGKIANFGGKDVVLDEGWYQAGLGNGFNGPAEQFVEHVNYTRLREVTLSYTLNQPWFKNATHLSAVDFSVTGRNLYLWTNYTGIDPETNLTGVSNGRGLDYFNNPSTRSVIFSVKFTY